jgi:hypothetical protein
MTPDPADPGDTVTVTNAPDGPICNVPPEGPQAAPAAEGGVPVGVFVLSSFLLEEEPNVTIVQSDDDGFFSADITAPERPGQHLVFAICGFTDEAPIDVVEEAVAAAEPVDEDGVILDTLVVTQEPLSIGLSDDSVEEGDAVIATFNRCQDENDFDQFDELDTVSAADPTPEELATDFPDLEVFLDGEHVTTVEGTERYPTGTVDVPVTLDEVGEHEISGVCTYQTFDFDFEQFLELIDGGEIGGLSSGASAAAIDPSQYPFSIGDDPETEPVETIATWDDATTEAADTVTVTAAAVEGTDAPAPPAAEPAPVQPTFAG